jgi:hypothetical protein
MGRMRCGGLLQVGFRGEGERGVHGLPSQGEVTGVCLANPVLSLRSALTADTQAMPISGCNILSFVVSVYVAGQDGTPSESVTDVVVRMRQVSQCLGIPCPCQS